MPRWRKLHVKTRQSLDINEMPDDFTRLLWVLMPLGLDREGRALDNVSWVKAQLMPLRTDVTLDMVSGALDWYADHGMIERYPVNGRGYFRVPTFGRYQGDTSREAESEFPPPVLTTNSRPTHEPLTSKSSLDADADSNIDSEAEAEEQPSLFGQAISIWEGMTGKLDALDGEKFADYVEEYGEERVFYAVQQCHKYNAPTWAYMEAVLKGEKGKSSRAPPNLVKQVEAYRDPKTGEVVKIERKNEIKSTPP